jgi:hypothetical protein
VFSRIFFEVTVSVDELPSFLDKGVFTAFWGVSDVFFALVSAAIYIMV